MSPKVWLVTGASRGLGRYVVDTVLKNGDAVIATARDPSSLVDFSSKYPDTQFLALKLDVTDKSDISKAFATGLEKFGNIDVVYNNAAAFQLGEAEGTPEKDARALFDVNFWGAANVSLEAVATFREKNKVQGGRLITVSSATGFAPIPGGAYYIASKFGIEGFTDALRMELDPAWNIKISVIQPGGYATGWQSGVQSFPPPEAYSAPHMPGMQARKRFSGESMGDPEKAAQVIYFKLARAEDPPKKLPLGQDCRFLIGNKLKALSDEFEKYESWSNNLKRVDPPLEL